MAAANLIGLDIGSTSVRAVEASRGKDGPAITRCGRLPLPPGAVRAGVVQDAKAVTLAVKQLRGAAKLRGRRVVLGLTNPQVVVRAMSVTNLPGPELRRSLPFQVADALPLPVERSLLDFHPLEDPGQRESVRGLLVAAPKDPVLAAVRAVERAGLHVVRVDLASFALLRAVSRVDAEVEAIVDVGARVTTVVVHAGGEPLIVRTVPRGGAEVTELLAARLGLSAAEAELAKCRVGLLADRDAEVAAVVRDAVRPLVGEIRSSFAYLTAEGLYSRVARLVLSGGGSLLPGLADTLQAELHLEVTGADPLVRVRDRRRDRRDGADQLGAYATVSIGLTLGASS
jgi:type IV pilus assembly protein PilM